MASTYLTWQNSTATNNTKFTMSAWVKRGNLNSSSYNCIMSCRQTSSTNAMGLWFGEDKVFFNFGTGASTSNTGFDTSAKVRDTNGWYHIVVAGDASQSGTDKLKVWINGTQQTSFVTDNRSSFATLEYDFGNTSYPIQVGRKHDGTFYWDGSMSHVHFVDGTAYQASDFGSTDATTGEWKINTSPSVTYGTNGFFILKNGNSVTDQSGNSNNFTVGSGTLTKTEDSPSNVFATINPLFVNDGGETNGLSNGNTRYYSNSVQSNQWNNMAMTLGASTGKYYWEVKYTQIHSTETVYGSSEGIASDLAPTNHNLGEGSRSGYGYGWLCGNRNTTSNTRYLKTVAGTSTLTTDSNNTPVAVNDIVGVAFDADNGKLWFHKNGTYIDDLSGYVGNPSTGAYPYHTGIQTGQIYTPWSDVWQNSTGNDIRKEYNFGNGYFGTTAVSSAGTNASGIGIFEFDVPNGFTALSTKGLNL